MPSPNPLVPVPFKWRDSVDVPNFLVKLNEIQRRTAKVKTETVNRRYAEMNTAWKSRDDSKTRDALINLETALRNKISTGPVTAQSRETLDAGLVANLRKDFDFDHSRPTVTVSRDDYDKLLKIAERNL